MAPSDDSGRRHPQRAGIGRWGQTLIVWGAVALGGVGLWVSAWDPLFGGPGMVPASLTMLAFWVAAGVVATVLIWCWPAAWKRLFHRLPTEGDWRLDAAQTVLHLLFWVLAILTVIGMVAWGWGPVAAGAVAGCLVLARLALDVALHHWLGTGPAPGPWQDLADVGRKLEAIQAYRRKEGVGLAAAKEAVGGYLASRRLHRP
jgi:hypothetical protein